MCTKVPGVPSRRWVFVWPKSLTSYYLQNKPIISGTMKPRLRRHLQGLGLWEGETTHVVRNACALTLLMGGVEPKKMKPTPNKAGNLSQGNIAISASIEYNHLYGSNMLPPAF